MNEVEQLSHEYAAFVDASNWDAAATLFNEDGVLVVPDPPEHLGPVHAYRGRAAIRRAFADLDAITVRTRHEVIGFEPDGRVLCLAHHVMVDRCIDWHLHYADTYAEAGGKWRIRRREVHIARIETHPVEPG
jgi:SnoaL-like domain